MKHYELSWRVSDPEDYDVCKGQGYKIVRRVVHNRKELLAALIEYKKVQERTDLIVLEVHHSEKPIKLKQVKFSKSKK